MNTLIRIVCCIVVLVSLQEFAIGAPQDRLNDEYRVAEAQYRAALAQYQKAPGIFGGYAKADMLSPLTSLQATVKGTFWRNPEWVKLLELSTDQQRKMDDIFQQYRLKLIDLTASLQKEELILEPLFGRTRPTPEAEAKILSQIDRIADARAELEKANSKMLVNILQVLTAEQWNRLPIQPKFGLKTLTKPAP